MIDLNNMVSNQGAGKVAFSSPLVVKIVRELKLPWRAAQILAIIIEVAEGKYNEFRWTSLEAQGTSLGRWTLYADIKELAPSLYSTLSRTVLRETTDRRDGTTTTNPDSLEALGWVHVRPIGGNRWEMLPTTAALTALGM